MSSVEMMEITGEHIRIPFPRRFTNQPRGDCFDTIRNCIALLDEVSDIDVSTSRDECRRYVDVRCVVSSDRRQNGDGSK